MTRGRSSPYRPTMVLAIVIDLVGDVLLYISLGLLLLVSVSTLISVERRKKHDTHERAYHDRQPREAAVCR